MGRKVSGFTILELLVIIAIISILMAFSIRWYINYELDRKLTETANSLVADLQWAKEHSVSSDNIYGIYIASNATSYTVFKNIDLNCSFSAQNEELRTKELPNGISFMNNSQITILFDRRGYVLNSSCGFGAETIRLKNNNNTKKNIVVSRYGRIRIE